MDTDVRTIRRELEEGKVTAGETLVPLGQAALDANAAGLRIAAYRLLGSLAGRAYGASWDVAERAAFMLLEIAREADGPSERALLLEAMGRGFRNVWLMPFVHSCLFDEDRDIVRAAISAAGGLAFPALEETIASFLNDDLRPTAIEALGRMGAESAADRLASLAQAGADSASALGALAEIRSRAAHKVALHLLRGEPTREVLLAAVGYLAEIGAPEVERTIRDLARSEDECLRLTASLATRALEAERKNDPAERILAALTEQDRAMRAMLARRLRTLPVAAVLEQAELLLSEDAAGVIQIIAEVRAPEVTKFLLRIAADETQSVEVRRRAAGSIEADEEWEREALVDLVKSAADGDVRAAAAQTLGAFAPISFVLARLSHLAQDPAPKVRGALLWALQWAGRPREITPRERAAVEDLVRGLLLDGEASVRRRAAYVAGNIDASALLPDLLELIRREETPALRIAGFVALGDIASTARFADLVHLWNSEDDPQALNAASRAIERSLFRKDVISDSIPSFVRPTSQGPPPSERAPGLPSDLPPPSGLPSGVPSWMPPTGSVASTPPPSLGRVQDRLPKLLSSPEPRVRAAAVRVAGLTLGSVSSGLVLPLLQDPSARVREKAVIAVGRVAGAAAEPSLIEALDDADGAVQERAAEALLWSDSAIAASRVFDFIHRSRDRTAAFRVAKLLTPRKGDEVQLTLVDRVLRAVDHEDPVYEPLLGLKVALLESIRTTSRPSGIMTNKSVDETIAEQFPTWMRLREVRGFASLAKSLRTAELLFGASRDDADPSAAIVLWMKSLEGYMHAWLSPRLRALQGQSSTLWDLTDRLLGRAWPSYQRYLAERWPDPVKVGGLSVEVPLRSAVNALRDLQDHRMSKPIDSPLSVTEWSRIMLFLAVDHPSGPKNVLAIECRDTDKAVKLAHKLQVLAQVRNAVTHREAADLHTLAEFRRAYYAAFQELTTFA